MEQNRRYGSTIYALRKSDRRVLLPGVLFDRNEGKEPSTEGCEGKKWRTDPQNISFSFAWRLCLRFEPGRKALHISQQRDGSLNSPIDFHQRDQDAFSSSITHTFFSRVFYCVRKPRQQTTWRIRREYLRNSTKLTTSSRPRRWSRSPNQSFLRQTAAKL